MEDEKLEKEVAITGIILPVKWDAQGTPCSVGISSIDEEEYIVENNLESKKLLKKVKKMITAFGVVSQNENGEKVISVKKFKTLKTPISG